MYCDFPEFGRCCICLPLRKGVLVFGYINIVISVLLVALYSSSIHNEWQLHTLYHGAAGPILEEIIIFLYLLDVIANAVLVYGAHMKLSLYLKIAYYYYISTTLLAFVITFSSIFFQTYAFFIIEMFALLFAATCIQIYLIALLRSLIRKLEISPDGGNVFENHLQQIVAGEVYENTVVPNQAA